MQQNTEKLDLEFGITQLNGNKQLYASLITKFKLEYQNIAAELVELASQQDYAQLISQVHSIKGISGNLGMPALQQLSLELEQQSKAQSISDQCLADFAQILNETLQEIEDFTASLEMTDNNFSKEKLIDALHNNVYLPAEHLPSYLHNLNLTRQQQTDLVNAINDLDYPTALALLGES